MKSLFPDIPQLESRLLCLRPLRLSDADDLRKLTAQAEVYRWLPTFLFEKRYEAEEAIRRMYDECLEESLIYGVFREDVFCGLAEIYGCRPWIHKVSIGYRLRKEAWGQGIASEALRLLLEELLEHRQVEIITGSTMVENHASAHVLMKNGFTLVNHDVEEDWGYPAPTRTDKWVR